VPEPHFGRIGHTNLFRLHARAARFSQKTLDFRERRELNASTFGVSSSGILFCHGHLISECSRWSAKDHPGGVAWVWVQRANWL
jgi:hypothetical protein